MAIVTDRLIIRQLRIDDAEFILKLLNQKSWVKYIGARNVRTLDDARNYIQGIIDNMYHKTGFGLWCVTLKDNKQAIGLAGLLQRGNLAYMDLGFALLDKYTKSGFMHEACDAIIDYTQQNTQQTQILAIAIPNNRRSHKLLAKLGFVNTGSYHAENDKALLHLFRLTL